MTDAGSGPTLVWFRRNLRDFDHAAFHHAFAGSRHVYRAFVFDRDQAVVRARALALFRAAASH